MKPQAFIGAAVGGLVGALIWAGIAYLTGYEIGYVAWGVGALVGVGAVACGGSGQTLAACCSVVAVVAILGGKALTISMFMNNLDPSEFYEELAWEAQAYAEVRNDRDARQFMVDMQYTEAMVPEEIGEEELRSFKESYGFVLDDMAKNEPGPEEWAESEAARVLVATVEERLGDVSTLDIVKSSIGLFDIIWFALGIVTAYRVALQGGFANVKEE